MMQIRQYTPEELHYRFPARHTLPIFKPCRNIVPAREAWKHVRPMMDLMFEFDAMGLAANQVGLDIPLFVMRLKGESEPIAVYRPLCEHLGTGYEMKTEMCLSLSGVERIVQRSTWISVDFIAQPNNKRRREELRGMDARVFLHEFDHLEGRTILDPY